MGGVRTNYWGETNVLGLFASGEVACTGVHGANRLASNSLLEVLIFSKRIVERTREGTNTVASFDGEACTLNEGDIVKTNHTRLSVTSLQSLLWENVGIVRSGEGLKEAAKTLAAWHRNISEPTDRPSYELTDMGLVGRLMAEAALIREESRGAHFRSDFPEPRDEWRKHIIFRKTK